MSPKHQKKRTTMVIAAPWKRIKAHINHVAQQAQKQKSGGAFRCELYIVITDCPTPAVEKAKITVEQLACQHWQDNVTPVAPAELRELNTLTQREQIHAMATYLAITLIDKLIQTPTQPRNVGLIWDDTWPVWTAAGSAVSAAMTGVSWWEPPGAMWMRLLPDVQRANLIRTPTGLGDNTEDTLIGECDAIKKVRRQIRIFAEYPDPVLIIGETGTGKELCAQMLHDLSGRERRASINGALLDPQLASSTLFGHKKGAFTGADANHAGRIMEANPDGTFFLDEINSVPLEAQAKLLRALQDADKGLIHVAPLGGKSKTVHVRFISALQHDPLVSGELRADLYYRIAGLTIELPPLRDRGNDVMLLSNHFIRDMNERHGDSPTKLDKVVQEIFAHYPWPGNVRELYLTLRQAWIQARSRSSSVISKKDLPRRFTQPVPTGFEHRGTLKEQLANYVVAATNFAMASHPNNKTAAARSLGFRNGQDLERFREKHARKLPKLHPDLNTSEENSP